MATFGRDHFYALDDDMRLDRDGLATWLNKHAGSPVLIFGFTFMVWEHLLKALSPGESGVGAGHIDPLREAGRSWRTAPSATAVPNFKRACHRFAQGAQLLRHG